MKFKQLIIIIAFLIPLALAAPPSLTDFHQFYGQINDLPEGFYTLKATVGLSTYETDVAADGKFGYSPTFKVRGNNGNEVQFILVSELDTELDLGTAIYENQKVEQLILQYPIGNGSEGSQPNNGGTTDTGGTGGSRDSRSTSSSGGTTPTQCAYNWNCGLWTLCSNGRQTRSCFRIDSCDNYPTLEIIQSAKPEETRSCGTSTSTTESGTCTVSTKRCLGKQLQQCSYDGKKWNTLQTCPDTCNSNTLTCEEGEDPDEEQPAALPSWIYFIIGGVLLLAILAVVIYWFINQRKYSPLKKYVQESKEKGYADGKIRSALINQGWDADKVDKYLG